MAPWRLFRLISVSALLALSTHSASSGTLRMVKIVVPNPPGSATSMLARIVADRVGQAEGIRTIVENRPGAGNIVGSEYVAHAAADGGTRKFPIKDIQFWRDYVAGAVGRYKDDIHYWEVWNEFNGSFGDSKNKVKDYAELVVTAYEAAKKADPDAKIGLSVANFDVGFLDAVIKAGTADHFDFICVHPYENLGAVAEGGEVGYLSLAGNLRKMLAANKQRTDVPLWITEISAQIATPVVAATNCGCGTGCPR